MSADEYEALKKDQLQRLARARGLDPNGTVAVLRDRLRDWDDEQAEAEDVEVLDQPEIEVDSELDVEEEADDFKGTDDFAGDPDETEPLVMALASPAEELKDGFFRYTIHAGNDLFFKDPLWHAANEEMALIEAGNAGYKHLRSMGDMEYLIEGNSVHYQFPVERQE